MAAPVEAEGIALAWYGLDPDFGVGQDVVLSPGDWLVYVNYFGLCEPQIQAVLDRFVPQQVVLDHSQALYCAPDRRALANIYSARKFVGVPDGGFLVSRLEVASPQEPDTGSLARTAHLLRRLGATPEEGYADYLRAEQSLADSEPRAMSMLTARLLAATDHEHVRRQRRANFGHLEQRLATHNQLRLAGSGSPVALCYPYLGGSAGLRAALLRDRIFVPTYWPDVRRRNVNSWTSRWLEQLLPLPIDQRYGSREMDRIVEIVLEGSQ